MFVDEEAQESHTNVEAPRFKWPSVLLPVGKEQGWLRWTGILWFNRQESTETWPFDRLPLNYSLETH